MHEANDKGTLTEGSRSEGCVLAAFRQNRWAQVLPLAFVAKSDEDKDVGALWGEVWEEATTGGAAALRLYIGDIVPLITAGESF